MKRRLGWLILMDIVFAVSGYFLLCFKWYWGLQYGYDGVGLLLLLGPLFVVANYGILLSELGLLSLVFSVGCYSLLFHSHKMFLKKYENGFLCAICDDFMFFFIFFVNFMV